jgi:hypothetical protein
VKKFEAFIRHQAFEPIRSCLSIFESSEEKIAAAAECDQ